jgi:hypothetical protein
VPWRADGVEITVQRQHLNDATGERTFRRDAVVTGGGLATGQQAIKFVCGSDTTTSTGMTVVLRSCKLRKVENMGGSTQSYTVKFQNETSPSCNALFGALVSPTDDGSDWPFPHPVTFPGEWRHDARSFDHRSHYAAVAVTSELAMLTRPLSFTNCTRTVQLAPLVGHATSVV